MTQPQLPTQRFTDAGQALAYVQQIYDAAVAHLRAGLKDFVEGEGQPSPGTRVRACYPMVRFETQSVTRSEDANKALSYGFVSGAGTFQTTLTRPDLFAHYYAKQFTLLLQNHHATLEIGVSDVPIPVHFSLAEHDHVEGQLSEARRAQLPDVFDLPDLMAMDDAIANGDLDVLPDDAKPLALFTAPRVDYSLHRLRHYTGTSPHGFQNFALLTNYQFYIDEFVALGKQLMQDERSQYIGLIEPGNVLTPRVNLSAADEAVLQDAVQHAAGAAPARLPQMPAYHLVRADRGGISLVNIGVGPSNAKTMTDHIAVLRPYAWIMLGHCAGLRNSQALGDYVLAHGYVREDHVLDEELPLWVPIPPLAEVQIALASAVAEVTQLEGSELKKVLRTGTVASTDNRNWELLPFHGERSTPAKRFSQSRAIALDMESATVAANGFRFRVPYGTLLCVSDKPLHGEIKLPGMANHFYRERVNQHLKIGILALEKLRQAGEQLHSRKLRSFNEVAFQ
jgi:AMP nucleosidase